VVYRGGRRPSVVFVGEAPGAAEDACGEPFVGRAGRRLDAAIATLGVGDAEFGVLNLIKCRPPANRFDPAAAEACRPYLDAQLRLLAPRRLVTLGAHALEALDPTAPRILLAAGRPRSVAGTPLFPLLHPAAVRSHATAARWDADVGALRTWLAEGPAPVVREPL
jgi:uracil-DNA glycosylase